MASKKKANDKSEDKNSIAQFFINSKNTEKSINDTQKFVQEKLASQIAKCAEIPNETQEKEIDEKKLEIELISERKKNEKLTSDLKKSVALIKEFSNLNLKKDIEIEALTRQISKVKIDSQRSDTLFSEFSSIFQKLQLNELRSIPSGKSKDSTFVLACMRFLYPNKNDLKNISLTGKMVKNERRQKMSQENIEIVTKMLNQRLLSEELLDELSISKRMKNINKLIKDAIYKIGRSKHHSNKSAAYKSASHTSDELPTIGKSPSIQSPKLGKPR